MREFNIKSELESIKSIREKYDKLSAQGKRLKETLLVYLQSNEVNLNPIIENEIIIFKLLGFTFRIKTETFWTKELPWFAIGELNLYLVQSESTLNDTEKAILSYNFDSIGNIKGHYLIEEFSKFFYRDFVNSLIGYCSDNSIKFAL